MNIKRPPSVQPIPEHATCVHKGKVFDVWQWQQELYDGSTTTFEKVSRLDTTVVFPVLPDGTIILNRQQQPGSSGWTITGSGGRLERGEDVFQNAQREMLEEAGCSSDDWVLWKSLQPIGKVDWAVYVFVARNCQRVQAIAPEAGEKIEPFTATFEEFLEIASGMREGERFAEVEVIPEILKARLNPERMVELKKIFAQV